jgi:hypothetical protein
MPSKWSTSGTATSWPTTTWWGPDPVVRRGWAGPYDVESTFHEPFVLFGYLAGFSPLEFTTGVLILPQRQTALVAKQAAEADLLSGGAPEAGGGAGVERGGVPGARKVLLRPGQVDRRAGRAVAPVVDRVLGDAARHVRARDRGGLGAPPGATSHPGVGRCDIASRLPPRRSTRRWLAAPGPPRPQARRGPGDRGAGGARGRTRSRRARHGGPRQLRRQGRGEARRAGRSMAGGGRLARVGQHHGGGAGGATATSGSWGRSPTPSI